jgi:hypothetical protein
MDRDDASEDPGPGRDTSPTDPEPVEDGVYDQEADQARRRRPSDGL